MADGSVIIEVELTKEQLEKGLKSLKSDLNNMEKSSSKISDKLSKGFETLGAVSTKAGKALTIGLTTPLIALTTAGVKYNAQLEQYKTALTTLTGSAEKASKIMSQIEKDAAKTPFDVSGLTQANQLLISTGLSADESRDTIIALGNAISATGGGNDELSRMAVNLQQIKNTGKATALDIKQFAYAGIDIYGLLADYTGKTKKEVTDMEVTWKLLNGALIKASKEGGKYFGAMEAQSETVNGKISNLKDSFDRFTGALTQAFIPTIKNILDKVTQFLDKFNELDDETKNMIAKAGLIIASLGPLLMIFGKISTGISGIISLVGKLKTALIAGGTGIKSLSSAFTFLTGPVGIAIMIITAVIALLVVLYNKSEKFRNTVNNGLETIKNALTQAWETLKPALEKLGQSLGNLLEKLAPLGEFLVNVLSVAFTILANVLAFVIDIVAQVLVVITNLVTGIITFFTETLPNAFVDFIENVKNFVNNIINWFKNLPYNIGLFIGEMIGSIVQFGINASKWVTTELPKIIQGIINWFKELPGNIWNWLKETVLKIASWLVEMKKKSDEGIKNVVNSIIQWFKDLPQNMKNIGNNIVKGLWNGIVNAKNWIVNKVKEFARGILDGMKNALGIHSPSRVFRDEVGKYIALGVGEGFTKNISDVYKKMKTAVDFQTQKLSANLSTTANVNKMLTANIYVTGDTYLDSSKVGRMVAPAVSRTLRTSGVS